MRTVPFFMRGVVRGVSEWPLKKSSQAGSQATGTTKNEAGSCSSSSAGCCCTAPERWSDSAQETARTFSRGSRVDLFRAGCTVAETAKTATVQEQKRARRFRPESRTSREVGRGW